MTLTLGLLHLASASPARPGSQDPGYMLWMDEILHLRHPGMIRLPCEIPTTNGFAWFQGGAGFCPSTVGVWLKIRELGRTAGFFVFGSIYQGAKFWCRCFEPQPRTLAKAIHQAHLLKIHPPASTSWCSIHPCHGGKMNQSISHEID